MSRRESTSRQVCQPLCHSRSAADMEIPVAVFPQRASNAFARCRPSTNFRSVNQHRNGTPTPKRKRIGGSTLRHEAAV